MGGQSQKKRKAARQLAYEKEGKRMRLMRMREGYWAYSFFFMRPLFLMEFLQHCSLVSIMVIAASCQYARDLVKAFFSVNLRILVSHYIGDAFLDVFFQVLEYSRSAIGGSTASAVLTRPYRHDWLPNDLNIFVPRGHMFMWREFLDSLGLAETANQPGVDYRFAHTTNDHVVYESRMFAFTITLSESIDGSILTLLMGATSTFCTNLVTCSDLYVLYVKLANEKRALEGWFPTPAEKAITMGRRRVRSSISTSGWAGECGWQCPILWRDLRGFEGVGNFRWGGIANQHADAISTVGIPLTNASMKWCLGEICKNAHCPWRNASYVPFTYPHT